MRGYDLKSETVADAGLLHLSGATVPLEFFQEIKYENGKPDLIACLVLADILYWYRPIKPRDEETGQAARWRQRFAGTKLQLRYETLGAKFGATERQARDACSKLKKLGLLTIEVKPVPSGGSLTFFEPNLSAIAKILKQNARLTPERESDNDCENNSNDYPTHAETLVRNPEPASIPTNVLPFVGNDPTHAKTLVGLRQNVSRITAERESSFIHEITTVITTEKEKSATSDVPALLPPSLEIDPEDELALSIANTMGVLRIPDGKDGVPIRETAEMFRELGISSQDVKTFEREWYLAKHRAGKRYVLTLKWLKQDMPGWMRARQLQAEAATHPALETKTPVEPKLATYETKEQRNERNAGKIIDFFFQAGSTGRNRQDYPEIAGGLLPATT